MKVNCPSCARSLVIPDERRGQKAKCPRCAVWFTVPGAAKTAAAPASRLPLVLALGGVAVALLLGGGLVAGLVVAVLQVNAPPPDAPEPMVARVATDPPAPPKPPEPRRVEPNEPRPTGSGEAPPDPNSRMPLVTFLESKAAATRVVFLADCSGSMNQSFGHVKKELTHSLQGLGAEQHFAVIFFNQGAHPMPHPGWLRGRADVAKILPWIDGFRPGGGTNPQPAFEQAFRLEPRPDVIFFMTDGAIPASVIPRVAALNRREPKVKINSIQFQRSSPSKAVLAKLTKRFKDNPDALAKIEKKLAAAQGRAGAQLRQLATQSGGAFSIYAGAPAVPGVPGSTPPLGKK